MRPARPSRCGAAAGCARHRRTAARPRTAAPAGSAASRPIAAAATGRPASRPARRGRPAWHTSSPASCRSRRRTGATPPAARFAGAAGARRRGEIGCGVVAGPADGLDQRRRPGLLRRPGHLGAGTGCIDTGIEDAGAATQGRFDRAGTGDANHAGDAQLRYADPAAVRSLLPPGELRHLVEIVDRQPSRIKRALIWQIGVTGSGGRQNHRGAEGRPTWPLHAAWVANR